MVELVSQREFARRLGVSQPAVHKAIKAGRITPDESGKIDVDACSKQWADNTDTVRGPTSDDRLGQQAKAKRYAKINGSKPPKALSPAPKSKPGGGNSQKNIKNSPVDKPAEDLTDEELIAISDPQAAMLAGVTRAQLDRLSVYWKLMREKMQYDLDAGKLIDAEQALLIVGENVSKVKNHFLGLRSKAKARMPHLSLDDLATLNEIVLEILKEISTDVR